MTSGAPLLDANAPALAAAAYDAWFERPWGHYAFAIESRAVRRALGPLEGRTVLDAGCETGRFSLVIARAGAVVVGLDRDRAALRIAAQRAAAVRARSAAPTEVAASVTSVQCPGNHVRYIGIKNQVAAPTPQTRPDACISAVREKSLRPSRPTCQPVAT